MSRAAVAAQTRAELLLLVRRGENLVVTMLIPLGVLVFFTKLDAVNTDGRPVQFLVPGVLALAVMATAMVSLGIATGYERRYGVLKRLGSTPLGRPGVLAAKTLTVLGIEAAQATVILVTAALLGWRIPGGGIVAAVPVVVAGTVAFAGIGLLMAGTLRAEATLGLANGLFLALLFLGGMAYPLDRLPRALESLATLLPAAALSTSLRSALDPGTGWSVSAVVVLGVWTVAAPLLAARRFRWEE
jgi:ABC-2 type transport system permease protein